MPTMEHLLPPAGILRPDHPFLTAWCLARERGLCGKQRPTSWGLRLACTGDARQSRQASATKYQCKVVPPATALPEATVIEKVGPQPHPNSNSNLLKSDRVQMRKLRPEKGLLSQEHTGLLLSPLFKSP